MKQTLITDDSGAVIAWFNQDKATVIRENHRFDGRNQISLATGSQWDHEALYLTAKGRWVLNRWSDYQGSSESYQFIATEEAYQWLLVNACKQEIDRLPEKVRNEWMDLMFTIEA